MDKLVNVVKENGRELLTSASKTAVDMEQRMNRRSE
jgi:hypothetical protein